MPRLLLITQTPQNPSHHLARSNRHHLQQPHKELTPQPRSYWSTCMHSTHEKVKPTYNQIRNQNHIDDTRHCTQSPRTSEQYSWWCAGLFLPITTWLKTSLVFSQGGMLCVSASIGWCRTQNNILSYLIHAGSAYTICVLFLFFVEGGPFPHLFQLE